VTACNLIATDQEHPVTLAEPAESMSDSYPGHGTRPGAGADDPVTGPMPALALHDGRMQMHIRRDVLIVTLDGGLDEDMAREIAPTVPGALDGAEAVVLDVDQVTLIDQAGFDILADAFGKATAGIDCCIVASRLSGRMVLERWGVTDHHVMFTSVADALQARAFLASGYGNGWQPESHTHR
jgi:anti-anti-sigma regulatory factor